MANVFRFLSVRPPVQSPAGTLRLEDEEAGLKFVNDVTKRAAQYPVWDDARRFFAQSVLSSSDYFTAHEGWARLRPHGERLYELLIACASGESSIGEFRDHLTQVISDEYAVDGILQWTSRDEFARLKESLWRSYYANLAVPEQQPHDRQEMISWLRILRVSTADFESEGVPPGAAATRELVLGILTARVYVPFELFRDHRELKQ